MKKTIKGMAFVSVSVIGFLIFYIIPFFSSFYYMFIDNIFSRQFVGFQNFVKLFSNEAFQKASRNTALLFVMGVPILMMLSFAVAGMIKACGHKIAFIKKILIVPMLMPAIAIVTFWKLMFEDLGVVNHLIVLSKRDPVLFFDSFYSLTLIIGIYIWKNIGYNVILFLCALETVSKEIIEAARVEGASELRIWLTVTIPMVTPEIFVIFIFSMLNIFKIFKETYLLMGDYPGEWVYTFQHYMNNQFKELNFQSLTTACFSMGIVLALITCLFLWIENKISKSLY